MDAWENFLKRQEKDLGQDTVRTWLRSLKLVRFDAGNIYLQANDSFQIAWFEEHMRKKAAEQLFNNNGRSIKVHLFLSEEARSKKESKKENQSFPPPPALVSDPLDSKATLDRFVFGSASELLFQFVCELTGFKTNAESFPYKASPTTFNPLYIYGDKGVGKSHLLMAIAHCFVKKGATVLFIHAQSFADHVVQAIRNADMQQFRQAYRHVDLLLIDDVHVLAKKMATQEEFFHTFNALQADGKQIILSANTAPHHLQDIEPRLMSRFEWGITFHLKKLSLEEMKQVIIWRSQDLDLALSEEQIQFLLETFASNPKSLHVALNALNLRSHLDEKSLHKQDTSFSSERSPLEETLSDLIQEQKQKVLSSEKITQSVAIFYQIPIKELLGKSQRHEYSLPRKMAMYLCREKLQLPYMKIGSIFKRDHSTVMTSIRYIQKQLLLKANEISHSFTEIVKQLES